MKIHVVTNTELGWDCVVGVYDQYELAENACRPHPDDLEYYRNNGYLDRLGFIESYEIHTKELNKIH